jgi:hypothetical protein
MAVIFGGILNVNLLGELFSVVGIFGGLLIFLFSLFFLKKPPKNAIPSQVPYQTPALYGQPGAALPPQSSIPTSAYVQPGAGAWRDTADLEPGSITENTTKLLEKDETPPQ